MPAQKQLDEAADEDAPQGERNNNEEPEVEVESDRSHSSSSGDKEEYVVIKLSDVRKEVQCPICLGIIRKTRTVMECLHRFCRECIDKSMRLGNNECPACRTHCASRRSLRDDPNFDALIAALYPDIDKYEEEELALHEDEMARNKQIQASIAQILWRQTEALGKKRSPKSRSQGSYRASHSRVRRNIRDATELEGSDDNEDKNDNDRGKGLSSGDERTEIKPKRFRRGPEAQFSQHSATACADGGGAGDVIVHDVNRDIISPSSTLAWGKNGQRSHNRVNGKNARNSRISKFVDHLRNSEEKSELDRYLMLVSLDEPRIPSLQQPYLCCRPTMSVRQLCQYVALQTALPEDEVELCLVKEKQASFIKDTSIVDPLKDKLRVLGKQETLAELITDNYRCGHLLMAYTSKLRNANTVGMR